jgi:hypothetical protein
MVTGTEQAGERLGDNAVIQVAAAARMAACNGFMRIGTIFEMGLLQKKLLFRGFAPQTDSACTYSGRCFRIGQGRLILPRRHGMKTRKWALAFVSALIAGAFLFYRFGWENNTAFSGWGWYMAAALLAGVGLAGVFRGQWLIALIGLILGPVLYETAVVARNLARDSTCCGLWPIGLAMVLAFCLPAPLLGGLIGVCLMRGGRLPQVVSVCAIGAALAIGAFLPRFQKAGLQRLESQTIPQLLRQIHDAEMTYSASQADGTFACDGSKLPGAGGKLAWYPTHQQGNTTFVIVGEYSVTLECLNDTQPRGFRLRAAPSFPSVRADRLSMDQSGVLVVVPVQ